MFRHIRTFSRPASDKTLFSFHRTGLLHLMVVWVFWSTTYLAMRLAVSPEGNFPPFWMGAIRMLAAGLILATVALYLHERLQITWHEGLLLFITGNLMWTFGNGLILWASKTVASGFVALLVSSAPIWASLFTAIAIRERPSLYLLMWMVLGLLGNGILLSSSLNAGLYYLPGIIAAIAASIFWGLGFTIQSHYPLPLSGTVVSCWQQLLAVIGFTLLALVLDEPYPQPSMQGWLSWGYLVLFGSVIAFTSCIRAVQLLPLPIAMTYSYVNPALALLIGWIALDEHIGWNEITGGSLIILAVIGIFRERSRH